MEAYERMPKRGPVKTFTALSAATGAGKSTSACALMVYLARTQWHTSAYVVPTIAVAEEIHRHLLKLTEGTAYTVACWTSVHKANASSRVLDQYAEQNVVPARRYTEQQFKAAQLVVTTHDRWKHELTTGTDLGVLKCNGGDRDLVVVDEEPELEYTVVRQPEDVSALASLLAPPDVAPEGAAHGFTAVHPAADTLAVVHERMRAIKDNATGQFLRTAEVVTEADAETLASVDRRELTGRIALLSIADRQAALELHLGTLQFLKLCAQGRVFYTRGNDGGFYAYGSPAAPQPRHLILDGTADLNGMYAIGKHVSVVNPFPANYERVRLHAVKLPRELTKEIGGKMNDKGMLRNDETVATYLRWFVPFLLEHTSEGQKVLVYAKKSLLDFGVHRQAEFNDSTDRSNRYVTALHGRTIHWCSFGRGRGLNTWKECSAYFRLGDFHLKHAVVLSRIAAVTGERYTAADLRRLNSGNVRDARIEAAQAAHLAVSNKQDAARVCVRKLDSEGKAEAADLFMVGCELGPLQAYRERMFPGSPEYRMIGYVTDSKGQLGETPHHEKVHPDSAAFRQNRSPKDGAAARIAELLLATELKRLTMADLQDRCRMRSRDAARTLASGPVTDAMAARRWTLVTRKSLGLPGKGNVLVRQ